MLSLAVPSLGSLLAEPLMVLADSAMVGHISTVALAGLTLASSINVLLVGLCIFLVYTTTALAARKLGAGDQRGAIKVGVDGLWLGLIVGVVLTASLFIFAPWIMGLFGAEPSVAAHGVTYLRTSCFSLIGMMAVLAGTGALRGQLDTRTPFVISLAGAALNVALNACLIYLAQWGIAGAGIGTSIACTAMGGAFAWKVTAGARRAQVPLSPEFHAIVQAFTGGIPLMIRTITMHTVIMATLWVAASQGTVAVAGRQIASNTWSLTSNFLDALAIAGQALIGFELGRGHLSEVRRLLKRLTLWGAGTGVIIGVLTALASPWWPHLFTSDPDVVTAALWALLVGAALEPLAGVVYMYDGVLIGAGDGWYLAKAGLVNVAIYAPALVAVWLWAPRGAEGLVWLWACYCGVFFAARWLTLGLRIRTDKWMQ
ncbi:MAG: MATE family efflux transporter [Actinomycetaceae bacterium]|nr:MATE family efflux transporter [Actinomycetaceae bacterium]MDY5854567.1 MATE family efflux transporter [Arcanobacterium sp.]